MYNLQIKDIDEGLYREVKKAAAVENGSVSQQVVFMVRNYLAQRKDKQNAGTSAQTLLQLAGSWDDSRSSEEIVSAIRGSRRSSTKLSEGL